MKDKKFFNFFCNFAAKKKTKKVLWNTLKPTFRMFGL